MNGYIIKAVLLFLLCCMPAVGCGAKAAQETIVQYKDESEEKKGMPETEKSEKEIPEVLHFVDAWGEWHDMAVDPEVERHHYDWSCLTNTDGAINYTGDERYKIRKGVDVSEHQGTVDWERVKAAGYEFAMLRIGYRGYGAEGNLYVDARFHENIAGQRQQGWMWVFISSPRR